MQQYDSIEQYTANMSSEQLASFEHIRAIVHEEIPDISETISYGMPAFKYKGKPVLYVGTFKDHMSLFPTSGPVEELKDMLVDYKVAKGTIQFTPDKPIPDDVIKQLIHIRLAQIADK